MAAARPQAGPISTTTPPRRCARRRARPCSRRWRRPATPPRSMPKGARRGGSSRRREARSRGSRAWPPRCVTFVSGGTEAANAALNPLFGAGPGAAPLERLIVSAGEHACVLSGHRFPARGRDRAAAARRPARSRLARGRLPPAGARAAGAAGRQQRDRRRSSRSPRRRRWSMRRAASSSATRCRLAGRIDCDIAALGADALMLSAHKIGGPEGRRRAGRRRAPGSASARRWCGAAARSAALAAGTENVAAIAGFGAAARACLAETASEGGAARWRCATVSPSAVRAVAPDAVVFAEAAPRLPNTSASPRPASRRRR